ncbi:MAG: recombination protein O N-terminal domain-containing protein [Parcubacteria group bacterium]
MTKFYKTLAIVLIVKEWRESDLLFSFYTREYGKVRAIAAGSRKIKSKLAGHLAGPGVIELVFVKGKAFNRITHAHSVGKRFLRGERDINYLSCVLEIIEQAVPEESPNGKIWNLLAWALENILPKEIGPQRPSTAANDHLRKFIVNIFILKLLPIIGYGIKIGNESGHLPVSLKEMNPQNLELIKKIQADAQMNALNISKENNDELTTFLKKYLEYMLEKKINSLVMI